MRKITLLAIVLLLLVAMGVIAVAMPSPTPSPTSAPSPTPAPTATRGDTGEEGGIRLEEDRGIPPIPPSQVRATPVDGSLEVKWQGTGSDIITHYIVYRRQANEADWEAIATVPAEGRNLGQYILQDTEVKGGVWYVYTVTAVDHYENESTLSEPTTPVVIK